MLLFFDSCGPMVQYGNKTLYVSDLNPEISTKWQMSRYEMFVFGLKCLFASLKY